MATNNAVRKNDMTSGHSCYPPQRIIGGSPNVFVNKRNVIRQGDDVKKHACGLGEPHPAWTEIKERECTVFVNGKRPTKLGDKMDKDIPLAMSQPWCKSIVITASSNVFLGD